eukprot:NODE_2949_length_1082_cov_19.331075_g2705_i0.p1 GENE.NODE_2949_length_1082_cov_19.331075_g2705_i0~~NODE_2949_length_1082_cov_19.331075_g2705_i0.p1  ORF type:complete len:219 (+),score=31.96 NODE_2949_length_1082_cov_19.331075_g2705_i0:157-813(+)
MDAAAWRHMFGETTTKELAIIAADRLTSGYLRKNTPVPSFVVSPSGFLSLSVVDFSHVGFSDYHVAPALVLLQRSRVLRCLHLDGNNLSDQIAYLVCDLFALCPTLARVTLSWNRLTNVGGKKLLEALKEYPNITWLDIEGNGITSSLSNQIFLMTSSHAKNGSGYLEPVDFLSSSLPPIGAEKAAKLPRPRSASVSAVQVKHHHRYHAAPLPALVYR